MPPQLTAALAELLTTSASLATACLVGVLVRRQAANKAALHAKLREMSKSGNRRAKITAVRKTALRNKVKKVVTRRD